VGRGRPAPRAGQRDGSRRLPVRHGRPGRPGLGLPRRPDAVTGTMTAAMTGTMTATARVWDAPCRHIDGMAIGTTVAALHERGALAMLAAQERTEVRPLRERPGAQHA